MLIMKFGEALKIFTIHGLRLGIAAVLSSVDTLD